MKTKLPTDPVVPSDARTLTVLVIDDNPADLELPRQYLSQIPNWSIDYWPCQDPREGLAVLTQCEVDVVLLDERLGELSGLEILREIREAGHACPVVVVSGHADAMTAVRALRAGAADFLTKDALSSSTLENVIDGALEQERMRLEIEGYQKELAAKNDALVRKTAELRDYQATMAHELKTPLTSVREFAQILIDGMSGELNELQEECLGHISSGAQQIQRYIDDMVDAARLDMGKFTAHLQRSDLAATVRELVASLVPRARACGVDLVAQVEEDLPRPLIDRNRIVQVITNLVTNALKFTPEGGRVVVTAQRNRGPSGGLCVSVADTGRGISPEHMEHVFERSYQVRESDASKRGGLGLGLSICKEIVELHGGRIHVESEPGEGSTFYFTIRG